MNSVHFHLILNHVPVLGTAFGLGILAFGLWRRSETIKQLALLLFTVAALAAVPVYATGEPAEDAVEGLPGVASGLVERHEEAAGVALGGVLALGAFALFGLAVFRRERPVAAWFGVTSLAGAFVVSGLLAWAANLGGQIRHSEIRTAQGAVQHHDD